MSRRLYDKRDRFNSDLENDSQIFLGVELCQYGTMCGLTRVKGMDYA